MFSLILFCFISFLSLCLCPSRSLCLFLFFFLTHSQSSLCFTQGTWRDRASACSGPVARQQLLQRPATSLKSSGLTEPLDAAPSGRWRTASSRAEGSASLGLRRLRRRLIASRKVAAVAACSRVGYRLRGNVHQRSMREPQRDTLVPRPTDLTKSRRPTPPHAAWATARVSCATIRTWYWLMALASALLSSAVVASGPEHHLRADAHPTV